VKRQVTHREENIGSAPATSGVAGNPIDTERAEEDEEKHKSYKWRKSAYQECSHTAQFFSLPA